LFVVHFEGVARAAGFITGYLLAWGAFSIAATFVQWALLEAALLSPMMESTSIAFSAAVLAAAGLYQFTPLKQACLTRCRSPWATVLDPSGPGVAIREGLRHGVFCIGCCGVLMALLFIAGVMNLLWIALIAAYVIVEKGAPRAAWSSRTAGALFCVAAVALLAVAPSMHGAP
jgi:predicted metal-binding membrane protein